MLFALTIASSGVRKLRTESTGPKISSRATVLLVVTLVKMVGRNQKPFDGSSHSSVQRFAPSASPVAVIAVMRASCSFELMAPMSVFLSSGSPSRRVARRRVNFSTTSSWMFSCTRSLEPAQQTCPWLKKIPAMMPSTASSTAASSKTMFAPLPPSSRVTRVSVPASVRAMLRPTAVEPVNAILLTPACSTSALPATPPCPGTMLTTPAGSPACSQMSANMSAVSGVVSAGLSTTVFPAASAGATFHASMSNGKFQGIICPATPSADGFGPSPA
ncbi:unannotated protein [freshwater metagenome]|uniref:Unannotated protein n=1 Tax=freshwater metagenome TaxID=449393 RepID=A0A6J6J3K4_9ZZZZ